MRPIVLIRAHFAHAAWAIFGMLLLAAPALAVTDDRAVQGAAADLGPAIPEPNSILLFLIGVGVVGYGVHRRRQQ